MLVIYIGYVEVIEGWGRQMYREKW